MVSEPSCSLPQAGADRQREFEEQVSPEASATPPAEPSDHGLLPPVWPLPHWRDDSRLPSACHDALHAGIPLPAQLCRERHQPLGWGKGNVCCCRCHSCFCHALLSQLCGNELCHQHSCQPESVSHGVGLQYTASFQLPHHSRVSEVEAETSGNESFPFHTPCHTHLYKSQHDTYFTIIKSSTILSYILTFLPSLHNIVH